MQDDDEFKVEHVCVLRQFRVRPIFVTHCYKCHSEDALSRDELKGGLRVDTREGLRKGGDSAGSQGELPKKWRNPNQYWRNCGGKHKFGSYHHTLVTQQPLQLLLCLPGPQSSFDRPDQSGALAEASGVKEK